MLDACTLVVSGVRSAPEGRVRNVGCRRGDAVGELEGAFVARCGLLGVEVRDQACLLVGVLVERVVSGFGLPARVRVRDE